MEMELKILNYFSKPILTLGTNMKLLKPSLVFVVFLLVSLFRLGKSYAGVPQPSYVLYGLAADEYGWPYVTNATVTLWINGVSNRTHAINGMIAPGVNFKFVISLDSGLSGPLYYSKAARPGDSIRITLNFLGQEKTIIGSAPLPQVGKPGQIRSVNLTAGADADGDGLPDEWELWIIQNQIDPRLKTIYDVLPNDDADGDGVSNIDEYRAGTDPANAEDYFFLEDVGKSANGRIQFQFLTIPGKTYSILTADLSAPGPITFSPATYSSFPDDPLQSTPIIGTGHFISIFTPNQDGARIFQAVVK